MLGTKRGFAYTARTMEAADEIPESYYRIAEAVRYRGPRPIVEPYHRKPSKAGSIYFIGAVGDGPVKIGFTTNIKNRLMRLQIGSPVKLELLAIEHGKTRDDETGYHTRFRAWRLHGEWFERSAVEVLIERINTAPVLPRTTSRP